ncbi:MAG: DNA-directed DNA polymerase II small subunit [Candidatus Micrarchaeaceae archaeon]
MGENDDGKDIVAELAERLSGRVIVSADIDRELFKGHDVESLIARIISYFSDKSGIQVLDNGSLSDILSKIKEEKAPMPIEVLPSSEFRPIAKETADNFKIRKLELETTASNSETFRDYFRSRFSKIAGILDKNGSILLNGMLNHISSIKNYANGREITILGMVYDKITTKNGHVLLTLEDESGSAKVLFPRSESGAAKSTFETANRILPEDIIVVKGKISGSLLIASSLIWPDIPIHRVMPSEDDVAIAFISDMHVGSKLFLEKQFDTLLKWLNGRIDYRKDFAGKIKYIILNGDLVDGIGIYPEQEKELAIPDIYKQYSVLFNLLDAIPDYIHVFVLPGNHDAVQRAEPQPELPKEFFGDVQSNIHLLQNPSNISIHGIKVLAYHGTSLDSIIHSLPQCSYARPETAMAELLRRRHLSPIYGGNIVTPTRNDLMVIDDVPDIFHAGHVHKNAVADYHGTIMINSGTWQARTIFQVKQGHIPSPALLPVYEAKSLNVSIIDFNSVA